eukprot:TRINITY_DN14744_c0_g1_i2.p1 TRINITY_DN14744_c0_g1~~TRINITY_DN14744_c0_g1_i2.p1  ORF type:complete len:140 (+),score=21.72 TRINITY_DN14744_c0_g1_i2:706-1125(+)
MMKQMTDIEGVSQNTTVEVDHHDQLILSDTNLKSFMQGERQRLEKNKEAERKPAQKTIREYCSVTNDMRDLLITTVERKVLSMKQAAIVLGINYSSGKTMGYTGGREGTRTQQHDPSSENQQKRRKFELYLSQDRRNES